MLPGPQTSADVRSGKVRLACRLVGKEFVWSVTNYMPMKTPSTSTRMRPKRFNTPKRRGHVTEFSAENERIHKNHFFTNPCEKEAARFLKGV